MPITLVPPFTIVQLFVAIWLLVRQEEEREGFQVRATIVVTVVFAVFMTVNALSMRNSALITRATYFAATIGAYTTLLLMCCLGVTLCYTVPIWTALFCCTAAYVMQNLAGGLENLLQSFFNGLLAEQGLGELVLVSVCTAGVYLLCYRLFVRRIERNGLVDIEDRRMLCAAAMVVLVNIAFDMGIKLLPFLGVPTGLTQLFRLIQLAVSAFTLFAEYEMLFDKKLQAQAQITERLMAERERQYALSRETIDAINLKCHDLRHQIRTLRTDGTGVSDETLAEIERDVAIYDARIETGNEALDTILTEKSLTCEAEGIELSCIADGHALDFMRPAEIYALFGNALDNAIEAVRKVPDASLRHIGISVHTRGAMVVAHVENAFVGELEFDDGLPLTTKTSPTGRPDKTNHGFGTRSMRATVERHGGTFACSTHDDTFSVNMLFPARGLAAS